MSSLLSALARVLFILASAIFLVSLLAAGVLIALVWLCWNLLRGRRPAWPKLQRFQGPWTRHPMWNQGPWARPGQQPTDDGVVDVEAREVPPHAARSDRQPMLGGDTR
jgi:hypothetical protein